MTNTIGHQSIEYGEWSSSMKLGDIVLYRYKADDGVIASKVGVQRPAIVVSMWTPTCFNLQVFTDCDNDFTAPQLDLVLTNGGYHGVVNGVFWRCSINEGSSNGQWTKRG